MNPDFGRAIGLARQNCEAIRDGDTWTALHDGRTVEH
jgi:hypothetical protein